MSRVCGLSRLRCERLSKEDSKWRTSRHCNWLHFWEFRWLASPRPPILVLSTLMGVMLRRIKQSRPLRRQHFELREPGIGRAPLARDRRERHGRKLPSVPGWRRSSAHQQPPCARLGALLPSPLLGRLLVRVPMPRRLGPMAGGYQRARPQPSISIFSLSALRLS